MSRYKHGDSTRTVTAPEYHTWAQMKTRCNCPTNSHYMNYGGRGIRVCKRWNESYKSFLKDMGRRPNKGMTLERIDNNGNYEPSNCKWATKREQAWNTRVVRLLTYNGQTKSLNQWRIDLALSNNTLQVRLKKGWPIEKALSPIKHTSEFRKVRIAFAGKTMSIPEWSREIAIPKRTLYRRLSDKWPLEKALAP